jgi:PKD repeat protein
VLASGAPTAKFTIPVSLVAGSKAEFDAAASKPTLGAEIEDYHWEFGDGLSADTHSPRVTHTYSAAGEYTVTLIVYDDEGPEPTAKVSEKVTVTTASTSSGDDGGESGNGGSSGGSREGTVVTTTTTVSTATTKVVQRPGTESNSEKLAKALKVCRKKKRKKRASCERIARKRYEPKKGKEVKG